MHTWFLMNILDVVSGWWQRSDLLWRWGASREQHPLQRQQQVGAQHHHHHQSSIINRRHRQHHRRCLRRFIYLGITPVKERGLSTWVHDDMEGVRIKERMNNSFSKKTEWGNKRRQLRVIYRAKKTIYICSICYFIGSRNVAHKRRNSVDHTEHKFKILSPPARGDWRR